MRSRVMIGAAAVVLGATVALAPYAGAATNDTAPPRVQQLQSVEPPVIGEDALMAHINELQKIADANGGNRAHGRPGFKASIDYVKGKLDAAGFQTTLMPFTFNGAQGWDLIADWPFGDPDNVVFVGAHLDSVTAGPGLNDNGSGSAALLENALTVSRTNLRPDKRMRFGWWGAEELGLGGSKAYVKQLSATDRKKINMYLNFDMVATKKVTKWGIYRDGDAALATMLRTWFADHKIPSIDLDVNGRSDHGPFRDAGIPASGFISEDSLSRLDPCYHQACDNASNVLPAAIGTGANVIAGVFWRAAGAKVAGADPTTGPSPEPTVSPEPSRGTDPTTGPEPSGGTEPTTDPEPSRGTDPTISPEPGRPEPSVSDGRSPAAEPPSGRRVGLSL